MNFWTHLPKPFFALAPMEDVTDTVFRQIVISLGKPDVCFTEFANIEAILHGQVQRLQFTHAERPLVAQIWGTDPQKFFAVSKMIAELGFDGIDINMGCPVKKIVKNGCSALIGKNTQVSEIIDAVRRGGNLPVSVKTRLGIKNIITEDWIGFLLTQGLAALTLHGRTVAELSKVPAHWDEIAKAVKLRNQSNSQTLIIGNGDIKDLEEARAKVSDYGVDGVMIGRGIFDNPALFNPSIHLSSQHKLELFKKHIELFEKTWGNKKNFAILKKFMKTYISGWEGATHVRETIAKAGNYIDLKEVLNSKTIRL
jgi:nifR3 family TIM-barrel protein